MKQKCLICKNRTDYCGQLNELKTKYNKLVKYLNGLIEFEDQEYPFHLYYETHDDVEFVVPSEILNHVGELK